MEVSMAAAMSWRQSLPGVMAVSIHTLAGGRQCGGVV
jgi:hypothetical protein